jgi:cohesin loading factor subunit SCC2
VIKLLKSFYGVTNDNARRIDISVKLVLRMMDEDDTVKDLAVKTIEELWFPNTALPPSAMKGKSSMAHNPHDKGPLLSKVTVIMGVSSNFKDRQSPLEDLLHKIVSDKDGDASHLHASYAEICEALVDGLVDASDLPGFVRSSLPSVCLCSLFGQTVINCVRTIHLFTSAYPEFLSGSNASTLLPYLKNATTVCFFHSDACLNAHPVMPRRWTNKSHPTTC